MCALCNDVVKSDELSDSKAGSKLNSLSRIIIASMRHTNELSIMIMYTHYGTAYNNSWICMI